MRLLLLTWEALPQTIRLPRVRAIHVNLFFERWLRKEITAVLISLEIFMSNMTQVQIYRYMLKAGLQSGKPFGELSFTTSNLNFRPPNCRPGIHEDLMTPSMVEQVTEHLKSQSWRGIYSVEGKE